MKFINALSKGSLLLVFTFLLINCKTVNTSSLPVKGEITAQQPEPYIPKHKCLVRNSAGGSVIAHLRKYGGRWERIPFPSNYKKYFRIPQVEGTYKYIEVKFPKGGNGETYKLYGTKYYMIVRENNVYKIRKMKSPRR